MCVLTQVSVSHVSTCVILWEFMNLRLRLCYELYIHTYVYAYARMYICMYVHMHVCTYVFMNEGMYTHSHSVCTYMDMSSMYTQT